MSIRITVRVYKGEDLINQANFGIDGGRMGLNISDDGRVLREYTLTTCVKAAEPPKAYMIQTYGCPNCAGPVTEHVNASSGILGFIRCRKCSKDFDVLGRIY
jgi:hypothetical protein